MSNPSRQNQRTSFLRSEALHLRLDPAYLRPHIANIDSSPIKANKVIHGAVLKWVKIETAPISANAKAQNYRLWIV